MDLKMLFSSAGTAGRVESVLFELVAVDRVSICVSSVATSVFCKLLTKEMVSVCDLQTMNTSVNVLSVRLFLFFSLSLSLTFSLWN